MQPSRIARKIYTPSILLGARGLFRKPQPVGVLFKSYAKIYGGKLRPLLIVDHQISTVKKMVRYNSQYNLHKKN